ncbi:MAG: hypothetical protein ACOCZR_04900, partial [Halanaerobiales bacterium]
MSEEKNVGRVVQVIGPVVDVEFPGGNIPEIYSAIKIVGNPLEDVDEEIVDSDSTSEEENNKEDNNFKINKSEAEIDLTVEVMHQTGDNQVRCV